MPDEVTPARSEGKYWPCLNHQFDLLEIILTVLAAYLAGLDRCWWRDFLADMGEV